MTDERRIVDVCDELHQWAALGDPYGLQLFEVFEHQAWLQERLNNWTWKVSLDERSAYDRLIYRLAEVTLVEVDVRLDILAKGVIPCQEPDGCDDQVFCSNVDCVLSRMSIDLWDNDQPAYLRVP